MLVKYSDLYNFYNWTMEPVKEEEQKPVEELDIEA